MISNAHGGQAVLQQVLYIGHAPMRLPTRIDHPCLSFSFEVVDARTFDAQRLLASPALEDNILALLCWSGDMRELVRTVLQRALVRGSEVAKDTAMRLLLLGGLRQAEVLVSEEVEEMPISTGAGPWFGGGKRHGHAPVASRRPAAGGG
ncbi:MAG: hypothetical protein FD149_99, partial [Rhodospirillaceae bacterium]